MQTFILSDCVTGSWNCWENFESTEAKWCILGLFETVFWKLELLRKFWKQVS